MPENDDIVIDVCKRCVIGGVGVFKRDGRGAQVMRSHAKSCEGGTEGVVTGRVRSESSRSGQALCWPNVAEVP